MEKIDQANVAKSGWKDKERAMKRACLVVLCLCLVGMGVSATEAGQTYQLKIANAFVDSNPRAVAMKWMGEELAKRSNGQIKAEYYGNGVLGKEQELFQMTSTGLVQIYKGGGWEPLSGKFSLWQIPFTFRSYEEAIAFNKSDYVKSIAKEASKSGIYIPAIGFTGGRNIQTVSKVVREPGDLKGLKMRSPGQPLILGFYRTLGANPISMAPTDVYMAFQTGVIDGACNDTANLWGYKLHEGAKNFTWIDYTLGSDPTMVSDSWYKTLPDDLKKIVDQVVIEGTEKSDRLTAEQLFDFAQKIAAASANVVKVIDDPALQARWAKAVEPLVEDSIQKGIFARADVDAMNKVLADIRAKKQ